MASNASNTLQFEERAAVRSYAALKVTYNAVMHVHSIETQIENMGAEGSLELTSFGVAEKCCFVLVVRRGLTNDNRKEFALFLYRTEDMGEKNIGITGSIQLLNEDGTVSHVAPRCFAGGSCFSPGETAVVFTLERMRRAGLLTDTLNLFITLQITGARFHDPTSVAKLPAPRISAQMWHMLTSGMKSDVILLVDDGELAAHWNILSGRSLFF